MWEVEYTDEFGEWFESLDESEQDSIDRNVHLLEQFGPALPDRYSKPIVTSRFSHMRELRVQHGGEPIRAGQHRPECSSLRTVRPGTSGSVQQADCHLPLLTHAGIKGATRWRANTSRTASTGMFIS